ncbi:hypothetical protein DSO57_1026656, partial [Entomophthora muscae]
NIPDINQILTEGKFWKRIEGFSVKNAQFNKDFPPLIWENKNQTEEKTELNKHRNNLSSRQAPTTPASTLCQPPAGLLPVSCPPTCPLRPSQLPASLKNQQLGKYFSKIRHQVDNLETCECCHNWIDRHHQLKDFGVYVITSKITGKIREYVVYTGVYGYRLGGVGQYQRGPGVPLGGVELRQLLVVILARWFVEWPMQLIVLVAPNP